MYRALGTYAPSAECVRTECVWHVAPGEQHALGGHAVLIDDDGRFVALQSKATLGQHGTQRLLLLARGEHLTLRTVGYLRRNRIVARFGGGTVIGIVDLRIETMKQG